MPAPNWPAASAFSKASTADFPIVKLGVRRGTLPILGQPECDETASLALDHSDPQLFAGLVAFRGIVDCASPLFAGSGTIEGGRLARWVPTAAR